MLCKISLKWAFFAHFPRGALGELYKRRLKSNKFHSFRLILPNLNLNVYFLSRNNENLAKIIILSSLIRRIVAHKRRSSLFAHLQNRGMTLGLTSMLQLVLVNE